jgi:hypothetical protein
MVPGAASVNHGGDARLVVFQAERAFQTRGDLFIELDRSRPRRWLCKVVGSCLD